MTFLCFLYQLRKDAAHKLHICPKKFFLKWELWHLYQKKLLGTRIKTLLIQFTLTVDNSNGTTGQSFWSMYQWWARLFKNFNIHLTEWLNLHLDYGQWWLFSNSGPMLPSNPAKIAQQQSSAVGLSRGTLLEPMQVLKKRKVFLSELSCSFQKPEKTIVELCPFCRRSNDCLMFLTQKFFVLLKSCYQEVINAFTPT